MTPFSVLVTFLSLLPALVVALPTRANTTGDGTVLSVPITNSDCRDKIANSYIVVYNSTCPDDMVAAHQAKWVATMAKRNIGKRSTDNRFYSTAVSTFSIGSMRAMALDADDQSAIEINAASEVAYIEADAKASINALTRQSPATTGLARMSSGSVGATEYVFDDSAGEGITAFIVDTGIMAEHTQFQGRAEQVFNAINNVDTDENGHGTHVAATIGGSTFGVAKKVTLLGVKVLDATGGGTNSAVLAGMNFVSETVKSQGLSGKSVMNMSLGSGRSNALNSAINAIRAVGCVPVVAAGNENEDASASSPASALGAITVGAIDQTTDIRANFSNFGKFVDVFAPGVEVQSAGIRSTTSTSTKSGTSMASPHVAGLVAYIMALENITDVDAVADRILSLAGSSNTTVRGNDRLTTNLIAFNGVS